MSAIDQKRAGLVFCIESRSLNSNRARQNLSPVFIFHGMRDQCLHFIAKQFSRKNDHRVFDDLILHRAAANGAFPLEDWKISEIHQILESIKNDQTKKQKDISQDVGLAENLGAKSNQKSPKSCGGENVQTRSDRVQTV